MKLLVTRPAAQSAGWVHRLQERGIDAGMLPLIGIVPPADKGAVREAWATLAGQRLVVFVSPNAVEQFCAARPAGITWPAHTLAGATGPGTRLALLVAGVPETQVVAPAADAAQFDSEALWRQLTARDWQGAHVLIVRGDGGREWLAETLRSRGAQVRHVTAYRRVAPRATADGKALLAQALAQPAHHVWLFSSSEAVAALVTTAPGADWAAARAIATHPRIEESARRAGFGEVTPSRPELDAVIACLQSLRQTPTP